MIVCCEKKDASALSDKYIKTTWVFLCVNSGSDTHVRLKQILLYFRIFLLKKIDLTFHKLIFGK